jgi:NAD(P)-dependent dehydrogenase (short-subunit alcohol dehydrogenase family)
VSFGPTTTTDEVLVGSDLSGMRVIVTGASSGLGQETARALASRGASVTLAVRNLPKAEGVAQEIADSTGNMRVDVARLELSEPASVRAFARAWLDRAARLDLLINNAGVMACPLARTPEGWEMQLATNHFGHFLLTCLLAPALKASGAARVVNLSSAGHRFSDFDFDDPHFHHRAYDKWVAYGQAKTANILFSVELNRRLSASGVTANAVHPGVIMTELGRHLTAEDIALLQARSGDAAAMTFKSIPAGAATSVWAAISPDLEGRGGLYLEDCHVAGPAREGEAGGVQAYALDPDRARRLWALTEQTLGERFDLN